VALIAPEMIPFLGLTVTGDLGPLTIYTTRRNKIVYFDKSPPEKPPSDAQLVVRNRWRQAALNWKKKPLADRQAWERIVQKAGLRITGYNYWISLRVHPDPSGQETVERLAGEVFP
jgi:hypothetical protein